MKDLLFDISPEEGSGQRRKSSRRKADQTGEKPAAVVAQAREVVAEDPYGFLAELDGLAPCPRCGTTLTDLIMIEMKRGHEQWLVQCGWECLQLYWVDPIPGVLSTGKVDDQEDQFRVTLGEWAGCTFDEIAKAGARWLIEGYAEGLADKDTQAQAVSWLAKNA